MSQPLERLRARLAGAEEGWLFAEIAGQVAERRRERGLSQADLAILVGTDFNEGIKGIGPKKALKLVQEYGTIESMPEQIQRQVPQFAEVRRIYAEPETIDRYDLQFGDADEDAVIRFLCDDRGFARDRVEAGLKRIRKGSLFR